MLNLALAALVTLITPVSTEGTYTDAAGGKHPWQVTASHALLWDSKPFVPVGGLFQVRSWAPNATEADFADDVAALKRLHAAGMTDLYLQPLRGGITLVKPASLQHLLDAVEAEGFTYGLSLADGPKTPLTGYQILPGRYLQDAPLNGGLVRFPVKSLQSALWCLADPGTRQILNSGTADVVAEGARVSVPAQQGRNRLVLFPERLFFPGGETGLPNVWEGFDKYRDDLLALFGQVKLGRGFRFFADPLTVNLSLSGEARQVVPSGPAFTAEWALYLSHRYATITSLEEKWGVEEPGRVKDFTEAAQLVPLWWADKGLPQYLHRGTSGLVPARDSVSSFWQDLESFKTESLRAYMNQLSVVLKRGIADVPVVYRSRGYSPLFNNIAAQAGFDGVGIEAYGATTEPIGSIGAQAYAQAVDAPRPLWLPVLAAQEARLPTTAQPGFSSKRWLFSVLDALRETGSRGFYVDGARIVDPSRQVYDLSRQPEQLAWLMEYSQQLTVMGLAAAPAPRARAVFYPRTYTALQPKALQDGSWLLPTNLPYVLYDFGAAGRAYSLSEPDGPIFYLWNPTGTRQIKLKVPKQAALPGAQPIYWLPRELGVRNKDILTLTIGPDPIRLYNFATLPLPQEAFGESYARGEQLQAEILKRKLNEATFYQVQLRNLKARYQPEMTTAAYQAFRDLQVLVEQMANLVRPYYWVEAENVSGYTFDQVESRPGASGGQVLTSTGRAEGTPPSTATFAISINVEKSVHVYLSATPSASFRVFLDGQPYGGSDAPLPRMIGVPYAVGTLTWYDCGAVMMPRGRHLLEVRAEGALTLDALLITPPPYIPKGPTPPPFSF